MIPGPDCYIKCPHCDAIACYETLLSGNTAGSQVWSDGRRIAPMLPSPPAVVICAKCSKCSWLSEAEEVPMEGDGPRAERRRKSVPRVQEPTVEQYLTAIVAGLARDRDEERALRVLAWWRGNDPARHVFGFFHHPGSDLMDVEHLKDLIRENLQQLAGLLDEDDPGQRIMKAEILRELGRFDEAKTLLGGVPAGPARDFADQILAFCERGDTTLQELNLR
jgi:hypothetical protein